jgi:hypothetical protein
MIMSEVGKHYRRGLHQEQENGAILDSVWPLAPRFLYCNFEKVLRLFEEQKKRGDHTMVMSIS